MAFKIKDVCPICVIGTDVSDSISYEVAIYMDSVNNLKKVKKRVFDCKQD